jgi:hypothetical protein
MKHLIFYIISDKTHSVFLLILLYEFQQISYTVFIITFSISQISIGIKKDLLSNFYELALESGLISLGDVNIMEFVRIMDQAGPCSYVTSNELSQCCSLRHILDKLYLTPVTRQYQKLVL